MKNFVFLTVFLMLLFIQAYSEPVNDILSAKNYKTGMFRFYNREYEASIQLFTKSLSFEPMNFKARYYLGFAYLNSGYIKNAIDEWENLVKLGGGNYQVKQKLNDLYFQLAIDKSYDYSSPYLFSKLYDGIENGMHKIIRPSFVIYDDKYDSILVSSAQTKFVVEIDGSGKVLRQFGRQFGDFSSFKMPMGVCLYDDRLYVADYSADKIVVFQRDGKYLSRFGVKGFAASNIAGPMGIAVSPDEYIFVVDNGNDRIQKFDLKGEWIQSIGEGELKRPTAIVIKDNILYISDTFNKRLVCYDTFGNLIEEIGDGQLQEPRGLCIKDNNLYIADAIGGLYVYNLTTKTLEKFGVGEDKINYPFGVCLDSKNILYETDFNTQNMAIYIPLQLQYANLGVQINQIWMSAYPNNFLHIRVWDKAGKPIFNLKEDNFRLFEEGTEIPFLKLGPTYEYRKNMYVKVIIDKSINMKEYDQELIESLTLFLQNATGSDWADFKTVNDQIESTGKMAVNVLTPIDFVKKQPYQSAEPVDLDKALHQSISEFMNINRNKALVLFTTGEIGGRTFGDYDADIILTYAKQNAVPIYIINFTDKNRDTFQRIADSTFGKYYTIKDIKEINRLYEQIKNSPPLEYIIGYEGLNLRGIRNFWVNMHLQVKYKDMTGVDDTGYYIPEFFPENSIFNFGQKKTE